MLQRSAALKFAGPFPLTGAILKTRFAAGESLGVDYIITRNPADFSSSPIEAVSPDQFILRVTDLE
jgi:hypothetical protein